MSNDTLAPRLDDNYLDEELFEEHVELPESEEDPLGVIIGYSCW